MDAFLAPLSLIFSYSATALLLQIMNRLAQKSIHSGFTFVIKQPLNYLRLSGVLLTAGDISNKTFSTINPTDILCYLQHRDQ